MPLMKSIKAETNMFSIEDFEKGLMLAGYLTPNSIQEIQEREELEKFESEHVVRSENLYFKRVVLAAEIVSKLHTEPSLGRIKFQKLVYLCEKAADMNLEGRYAKQAAGPFDNKFMHSIANEFKKNKWFSVVKEVSDTYSRYKYFPLENSEGYKAYYSNYFSSQDHNIQFIIELFRKKNTDFTELATTVFACFLELQSKDIEITPKKLTELFYNWSEKKKRFSEAQVMDSFQWLKEKGLVGM
jgi:uncharacterized protein YwgA